MICILHGYLLDGSGSNLWTQSILRTLCQAGQTVHVMCQEPHPEKFDYIARAVAYDAQARPRQLFERKVPYPGSCVLHKPTLGEVLPVYVWDKYEEYAQVVPMVDLDDAVLEDYVERNAAVLEQLLDELPISAVHVNHAVLMSVVAQRVCLPRQLPYAIMPHGSALEYAVKKDPRLYRQAAGAFAAAKRIFVIGPEIHQRVCSIFAELPGIADKTVTLNLGVDTSLFAPVAPVGRRGQIEQLERVLQGVERGKQPEQSRAMRHKLSDTLGRQDLRRILSLASDYTAKHPDSDCEGKLSAINWQGDKILLFVGRLIASKGLQGLIAALPAILEHEPRARLVVVGHGPLREPLEALLWALDHGKRQLLDQLLTLGKFFEGAREPEPLVHVQRYLARLEREGQLEDYLARAQALHVSSRVTFTGYLTHRELRHLFPCCDLAAFPSIVAEAGPLVFLEAMASGVFPLGIYFAGMGASIDAVAGYLPPQVHQLMKLSSEPEQTVADIVDNTLAVLALDRAYATTLHQAAVERFDWRAVGERLVRTLEGEEVAGGSGGRC